MNDLSLIWADVWDGALDGMELYAALNGRIYFGAAADNAQIPYAVVSSATDEPERYFGGDDDRRISFTVQVFSSCSDGALNLDGLTKAACNDMHDCVIVASSATDYEEIHILLRNIDSPAQEGITLSAELQFVASLT